MRGTEDELELPRFRGYVEVDGQPVFSGVLDASALNAMRAVLDQATFEPIDVIAIDASQVGFIDSTAVHELMVFRQKLLSQGRDLWLDPVSSRVAQVLARLNLDCRLTAPTTL
jgi:anti-anti-sigma regulatory factor